jgi:hypothetical protein
MRPLPLLLLALACQPLDLPARNVCYGDHVVPLVRRDCAPCHENGEYNVPLAGDDGDLDEIRKWVMAGEPDSSLFLLYAAGAEDHPIIWTEGSDERRTFAAWIQEGARATCFDIDDHGECRDDSDCARVSCYCPGTGPVAGTACYVNPTTDKGVCADQGNCTNPALGLCPIIEPDLVHDDVIEADTPDVIGLDTTQQDTGPPPISFADEITPLHAMDCVVCHGNGGFGVKIKGTVDDHPVVMEYVNLANPASSEWLDWANGKGAHPINWPAGGPKYNLFLQWVEEGAKNN